MTLTKKLSIYWIDNYEDIQTMQTIHAFLCDDDLEARIADVVITTTSLVDAIKSSRRVVPKKKQLRQAFAELANLKAQRNMSVIHRLDCQIGLGDVS